MVRKMGSIGLPQVDFHEGAAKGAADKRLRAAVVNNTFRKQEAREQRWAELPDIQALRSLGAQIKQHTLDNLDFYLDQLKTNVERNGGHVHFAKDGAAARQIIFDIIAKTKSKKIIKSKSMASEEIELTSANSSSRSATIAPAIWLPRSSTKIANPSAQSSPNFSASPTRMIPPPSPSKPGCIFAINSAMPIWG
jgi:hypothetical protein